jgi:hypothetical protein
LRTLDDLAAAAGCSLRTLQRWTKEGAPKPGDDEDLPAWAKRLLAWRSARPKRSRNSVFAAPPALGGTELRARTLDPLDRNRTAQAVLREMEIEVRKRELMPRAEVVAEWRRRVLVVRSKLLALPRAIAGRCVNSPHEVIESEASVIVRDLLLEFAADGEATPAEGLDA